MDESWRLDWNGLAFVSLTWFESQVVTTRRKGNETEVAEESEKLQPVHRSQKLRVQYWISTVLHVNIYFEVGGITDEI